MEERDIYEKVNPEDVNDILEKVSVEKLPQRREVVVSSEQVVDKTAEEKMQELSKEEKTTDKSSNNPNQKPLSNNNFLPKEYKAGDIITVTVVKIDPKGVYVSAQTKEDVFIPLKGLSNKPISSPEEVVKVGGKIEVMVLRDGPNLVLSKKLADISKKYNELIDKMKKSERVKANVVRVIKGGLLLDIDGVSAFLPQSQVGLKKGETLDSYVGKELEVELVEIEPKVKRVIASRINVLKEEREKLRKLALVNIKKDAIYEGVVRSIQDFGVFVDLGKGIDGLIRVNELNWGRRKDPHEILKVGQKVKVKVLSVNLDTQSISLSLRQTKPHPWETVEEKYPIESIVEGTVIRIHPFGVVVEIEEGITGLIHISQLDSKRIDKIENFVKIGDKIKAKVLSIDKENRKMKLSRKALLEDEKQI